MRRARKPERDADAADAPPPPPPEDDDDDGGEDEVPPPPASPPHPPPPASVAYEAHGLSEDDAAPELAPPLFFLDVATAPDVTKRLAIHDDDDPAAVVARFALENSLPEDKERTLLAVLEGQIALIREAAGAATEEAEVEEEALSAGF